MITSGLVNQQRARFEKGFPQVRDNFARSVRFEDPFVQTNVYSKLSKSEFVKPENLEINPSQVFFHDIFGKSTTADERNYLAHQLLQSKKAPRSKSHKMRRNIPEPDLNILTTDGASNSVLYKNVITDSELGSINVHGTTSTVPLNQDISIGNVERMGTRFNRPLPPQIDTFFHDDQVTASEVFEFFTPDSTSPMIVSSGPSPASSNGIIPVSFWEPYSPPRSAVMSDSTLTTSVSSNSSLGTALSSAATRRSVQANGLALPVNERRRVTDSNVRPDPRLINFPTPTETFLVPPTSKIGKRRRDSVGGGGKRTKVAGEELLGKRRRDSVGGGGGKRTKVAGEELLGKRRRESIGGGGGKRKAPEEYLGKRRRESIGGGGGKRTRVTRKALGGITIDTNVPRKAGPVISKRRMTQSMNERIPIPRNLPRT